MSRIITVSLLAISILLQTGCYKTTELTYDELRNFNDTVAVSIITKHRQHIIVSGNSSSEEITFLESLECIPCSSWAAEPDTIKLKCIGKYNDFKVGRDEIYEITIREKSYTFLAIGVLAGFTVMLLLVDWIINMDFDFSNP